MYTERKREKERQSHEATAKNQESRRALARPRIHSYLQKRQPAHLLTCELADWRRRRRRRRCSRGRGETCQRGTAGLRAPLGPPNAGWPRAEVRRNEKGGVRAGRRRIKKKKSEGEVKWGMPILEEGHRKWLNKRGGGERLDAHATDNKGGRRICAA